MPTYEYRCETCDRTFDVVQSFHDDPLTECPTCGSPVRKVFGNVGIVFKGSGFYKTDSRSGGSSRPKEASVSSAGGDSSDKSSGTDGGGDSKASDAGSTSAKKAEGTKPASTSPASTDKATST